MSRYLFVREAVKPLITVALLASMMCGGLTGCSAEAKASRHLSRADKYFKGGEFEKAKIEYANVLQADPKNVVAFRQLGLIWAEQGAPLRALPYLFKSRELEPNNPEVRTKIALALGALRQIADSRKEALAALEQAPGNEEAMLLLIDTALTDEDLAATQNAIKAGGKAGSPLDHLSAAQVAGRKQDLNAVEMELKKALELDPKSASAHSAMGNLHLRRGKIEDAGVEFKTAAELAPPRSPIRLKYAEFLGQSGKRQEADASLESMIGSVPDYLPAWNLRALNSLATKKYDEALAHLQNVLKVDGANFDARLIEGQIQLAKKDGKKAVEILDALDKTYENVPPAKYFLARAHLLNGDIGQANTALSQAIAIDAAYAEAIILRAEIDLRAGNANQAIDSLGELVKKRPNLTQAQLLLAGAYQAAGQIERAVAIMQEEVRRSPQSPQAQWLLSILLQQQGKVEEARAGFDKLNEIAPQNLQSLSQLVKMDVAAKDFDGALKRIDERLKSTPEVAEIHVLKGGVYAIQRDWERAEAELKRAIELEAAQVEAYQLLSGVYVASGKVPQALAQLEALLAQKPDTLSALMMSAVLYGQAKQPEKARDAYERVLAKQQDFAPALNNLAWIYAEELGDLNKARELARKARSLRAGDPAIADTFGWILYKSGDYQQALAVLREAAAGMPDNPEVTYHLGMASYAMGDEASARASLEKAVQSNVEFSGKAQISPRLRWLKGASQSGATPSVEELKEYLKIEQKDPIAWARLGEAYQASGAHREAADAFKKSIEANPQFLPAMVELAKLLAGPLKEPEKALELVKAARLIVPKDPRVSVRLGQIVYEAGDFPLAYTMLQESLAEKPEDSALLQSFAWAAYATGRISEARTTMEKVAANAADNTAADDARTFLKWTSADAAGSKVPSAEMDEVLKAKPGYVPALMIRGAQEAQAGDRAAAIATYNEVLRIYPRFAPGQQRLASLYLQSPDTRAKAHDLAVSAQKTLPEDNDAMKTLAVSSYYRKEFGPSVRLLEASEGNAALSAEELFILGMGQHHLKRITASRTTLERAVAAGLTEPLLGEAEAVLATKKASE